MISLEIYYCTGWSGGRCWPPVELVKKPKGRCKLRCTACAAAEKQARSKIHWDERLKRLREATKSKKRKAKANPNVHGAGLTIFELKMREINKAIKAER